MGSALSRVGTFFLLLRDRGLARYLRACFDSCYGRTSAPRRGTEVVSSAYSLASCTAIGFDRFVDLILCSSCECRGLRWYQSEARRTGLKQSSLRLTEVTRSLGDLISCVFESSTRGSSAFSSEDCPATPLIIRGLYWHPATVYYPGDESRRGLVFFGLQVPCSRSCTLKLWWFIS